MSRTVTELIVMLTLAGASALIATVISIGVVIDCRRDVRYVKRLKIKNGRAASAYGEYRLAIVRVVQSALAGGLSFTIIYAAAQVEDLERRVDPLWMVFALLMVALNLSIVQAAFTSTTTRRRVIRLGIDHQEGDEHRRDFRDELSQD